MPYTGQEIANSLGVKGFTADRLYDPEINIGFSAWYVRKLIERYGGNEALAIASYNAGPDAVDRWLTQRGDLDLDEFVEEDAFYSCATTRTFDFVMGASQGTIGLQAGSGVPPAPIQDGAVLSKYRILYQSSGWNTRALLRQLFTGHEFLSAQADNSH
jgi:hypothetical protein